MIEDALRTRLLTVSAISNLIGQRMYVLQAPQAIEKPYVVYLVISTQPTYAQGCISDETVIQYSVFATTYAQARTIANLIRTNLENVGGDIGGVSVGCIKFDGLGASEREKESQLAHISYDFRIILN
jgi:hypothetical protein